LRSALFFYVFSLRERRIVIEIASAHPMQLRRGARSPVLKVFLSRVQELIGLASTPARGGKRDNGYIYANVETPSKTDRKVGFDDKPTK
jgi:hypothetical protein